MRYLSAEESRNVDWLAKSQGHIMGIVLMENAGRGIAEILLAENLKGKVAVSYTHLTLPTNREV